MRFMSEKENVLTVRLAGFDFIISISQSKVGLVRESGLKHCDFANREKRTSPPHDNAIKCNFSGGKVAKFFVFMRLLISEYYIY